MSMEEFRGVMSGMGGLKDGSLEEKAILYDDNGRGVMEFSPTFKVAKDATIKGGTFKESNQIPPQILKIKSPLRNALQSPVSILKP